MGGQGEDAHTEVLLDFLDREDDELRADTDDEEFQDCEPTEEGDDNAYEGRAHIYVDCIEFGEHQNEEAQNDTNTWDKKDLGFARRCIYAGKEGKATPPFWVFRR